MEKESTSPANKKPSNQVLDKATETYKWWDNLATMQPEDPIPLTIAKIFVRIVGIIILVALSPIALIAVIIAFFAVL